MIVRFLFPPFRSAVGSSLSLVIIVLAVYAGSMRVPLLMDDRVAILENSSIRTLSDIGAVLNPPLGTTTRGRPLLNLSFAANYAFGGVQVEGYHIVNLVVHALAGLVLLGLVRRSLELHLPRDKELRSTVSALAFVVSVIWLLHPVQTASITYVSQRAEALMGLFYLLALYCYLRAQGSGRVRYWLAASVGCSCAAQLTKEVAVTLPLMILLFDRCFLNASFRAAIAKRPGYYLCLAFSWIALVLSILHAPLSDKSAGFGAGIDALTYSLTESRVVPRYAALGFWPNPLVFDYGREMFVPVSAATIWSAIPLLLSAGAALLVWKRYPRAGFFPVAFFLLLLPSSSFVPVAYQPMAENRLYLPLVTIVTGGVLGVARLLGTRRLTLLISVAIAFALLTVARNRVFQSEVDLWRDSLAKHPNNSRGHYNLGVALANSPAGSPAAILHYRRALELAPDYFEAHNNLGFELAKQPELRSRAMMHFEAAIRLNPSYAEAYFNLGNQLVGQPDRRGEAIASYERAIAVRPHYAKAHNNLAVALAGAGQIEAAIRHLETAAQLDPTLSDPPNNLAQLRRATTQPPP